jgi:hypothetical protein
MTNRKPPHNNYDDSDLPNDDDGIVPPPPHPLTPVRQAQGVALTQGERVWLDATQTMQNTFLANIRSTRTSFAERRATNEQRAMIMRELGQQYLRYVESEAKLSSDAALKARRAVLEHELLRMRSQLYTEMAQITGKTLVQIEKIFLNNLSQMTLPAFRDAYTNLIMQKILEITEHPDK